MNFVILSINFIKLVSALSLIGCQGIFLVMRMGWRATMAHLCTSMKIHDVGNIVIGERWFLIMDATR